MKLNSKSKITEHHKTSQNITDSQNLIDRSMSSKSNGPATKIRKTRHGKAYPPATSRNSARKHRKKPKSTKKSTYVDPIEEILINKHTKIIFGGIKLGLRVYSENNKKSTC